MLKKLLPMFSLLLGLAGGGAAAIVLAPDEPDQEVAEGEIEKAAVAVEDHTDNLEIVKLSNQFVIPVILNSRVRSMVILTVALEVDAGEADRVRTLEPKIRDSFLIELFNLAAMDGFKDQLVSSDTLELVKKGLTVRAKNVLDLKHVSVLVTDMSRQDVR